MLWSKFECIGGGGLLSIIFILFTPRLDRPFPAFVRLFVPPVVEPEDRSSEILSKPHSLL